MMTTPTHITGLDLARPASAQAAPRPLAVMPAWHKLGSGTADVCDATGPALATGAFFTTIPAGAVEPTANVPARSLGTRST